MSRIKKLRGRIAEALREVAFRFDGRPLMHVEDVEASLAESCAQHHAQDAQDNMRHAHEDAQQAYAAYCAQNQAGEMGFWVPVRGSRTPN